MSRNGKVQTNVFTSESVQRMLDAIVADESENGSTSRSQIIERWILKDFRRRKLKLDKALEDSRK
jgi:hypothetical protein